VTEALVAACRSIDPEPIAELALELVRIWSPPGDERAMADRVATALTEAGARVRIDEEFPASPSVIAEIGASDGAAGPTLQWHGHLDAIEVVQPDPRREGDRIVGRGAADMKGDHRRARWRPRASPRRAGPHVLGGAHRAAGNGPARDRRGAG